MSEEPRRLIVGISGASGQPLAVEMLKALNAADIEAHLVMSETARELVQHETGMNYVDVESLACQVYQPDDLFASISSGSFKTMGMVVIPCSMRTLAGVATGNTSNLLLRAADVCLKERRRLVLVARETPLNLIHIKNMKRVTEAGAIVFPPVLTMYSKPKGLDEMVKHIVGKVLDLYDIEHELYERWQ